MRKFLFLLAILFSAITAFGQADVSVSKTGTSDALVGTDATYTVTVQNLGPAAAAGITMTDTIPSGMTFVSVSPSAGCVTPPVGSGGSIVCTIATLANGASTAFTIVLHIPSSTSSGTTFTNVATVSSGADSNANNDTASATTTTPADVGVSKSGPAVAAEDTDVTYDVSVTAIGPNDAGSIVLTDAIPSGMTFVSITPSAGCTTPAVGSGGTITCTIPSLAAGTSADFSIVLHITPPAPPGTIFTNVASVSSGADPNEENDSALATTSTPPPPQSDGSITKNGPSSAGPDTDVVYTIAVNNGGPDASASFSWTDTLPGTMTFVSLVQNTGPTMICTTGTTVTCSASNFPAFTTATFTLTGHIPAGTANGTTFQNTATVTATNDPAPENDSSVTALSVSSVDLSIAKQAPPTATAGTPFTYAIQISNAGSNTAVSVTWSDTLPPNTTFSSLTQNTGPAPTCSTPPVGFDGTVTCSWSSLAAAATADFTLEIVAGNTSSVTNTASVGSQDFDTNTSNNSSSATTTITPVADMSITKTGPASINAGADITYTITVQHGGPTDASNVVVSDTYPPSTTFVSATQNSGPAGTCTPGPTSVSCTIASFPAGATAVFTFVFNVSPSATVGGTLTNTATVSTSTSDPSSGNNTSSTNATIAQSPNADLAVTKTGPATVVRGTNISYNVTLTNNGPGPANNVTLTDTLPPGTTFVSATQNTGPSFNCTNTTTTITCTIATFNAGAIATFTFVAQVGSSAPVTITNNAGVTSTTTDPTPGNSTASSAAAVTGASDGPTLSPFALALLTAALAMMGVFVAKRG